MQKHRPGHIACMDAACARERAPVGACNLSPLGFWQERADGCPVVLVPVLCIPVPPPLRSQGPLRPEPQRRGHRVQQARRGPRPPQRQLPARRRRRPCPCRRGITRYAGQGGPPGCLRRPPWWRLQERQISRLLLRGAGRQQASPLLPPGSSTACGGTCRLTATVCLVWTVAIFPFCTSMDNTTVTIYHLISQAGWYSCNLSIYLSPWLKQM